jgi:hypothetical protein
MDTTKAAQELRNQGYANEAAWRAARGQRVAQGHKQIFDALENGTDPIPAVAQLKGHWDSMMPEQTTETGLSVMKSMSEDGNVRGISDDTFNKILAGVQGKYHDHFEADPEGSTAPELINELTKRKFLPAFTPAEIEPIYNTALQQAMGDPEVAKIYAVNALYAAQQERLPAAREAMRNAPVQEGISKSDFKVEKDGEKDADYISAIIQLYPHTKNAVALEGDSQIPLTQAIYKRDSQLSEKMFDTKGSFQTANKAQYDAWRDAVLEVARTYNPTTRQGMYQAVANKPATPISIEDMVAKDVNGKYIFQPRIKREMERAGSSPALRDAIAFVDDKQKPTHQIEEDMVNAADPEKLLEQRKGLINSDVDEQLVSDSDLNAEADSQGLSGAEKAAYIEANRSEQPLLGEKVPVGSNSFYDVALHLMQKVDTASNATLWNKYGGERLFGKGAKSPGKMDLFKQAVLARMEGEMDDTGKLTAAQKSFYEAWRANASKNSGEQAPLAKTWEEQRQQFRHAQRLYWGTGNPVSMPDLFMSMLDDKPKYQQLLQRGKAKSKSSISYNKNWGRHWPHGMWLDPNGKIIPNETGHMETGIDILGSKIPKESRGDYEDHHFDEIFDGMAAKGYVQLRGEDGELRVISKGLTRTQKAALERYGIEHDSKITEIKDGRLVTIYEPPTSSQQSLTPGQPAPAGQSYMYSTDHQAPIVDAMMIGQKFALSQGLPADVASEVGTILAKAVQVFDEVAGYGTLVTEDARNMGVNYPSNALGGPVASVSLDNISKKVQDPMGAVIKVLSTSMHELAHNYSDHIPEGMVGYRPQRADAYAKLEALMEDLGKDAADDLLNNVLPTLLLPPQFQNLPVPSFETGGGQTFGQEAISRLMEHVMLGALTKDNPMQTKQLGKSDSWGQATKWLPDEVQATMHLAMRDLTNIAGAIKQYYRARPYQKGDLKVMSYIEPMLMFANEYLDTNVEQLATYRAKAQEIMTKFTEAGASEWVAPVTVKSAYRLDNDALREISSANRLAMSLDKPDDAIEVQQTMFGGPEKFEFEHTKRLGTTVPPWSKYIGLFYQMMRRYGKSGVPLANDVTRMVNDLEPSYFRLTREMHDPFLTYDAKGRLMYDPENPVLKLLQRSDAGAVRAREKINELYLWQNEHGKSVLNNVGTDSEGPQKLKETIKDLAPAEQQAVQEGLLRLRKAYTKAADIAFSSQVENSGGRLAALFMSINKSMFWEQAFATGRAATEAAMGQQAAVGALKLAQEKEPLLVPQRTQELQAANLKYQQALGGVDQNTAAAAGQYLLGPEGLAQKLLDLNEFFTKRQDWFGSESRPGKVFIISKMPDGENHYTSAPTEQAAKKVMKELMASGHTGFQFIDRNQKDDFDLFNSPDAVVNNFLKLEEGAWKKFVQESKAQLGIPEGEGLETFGYQPGQASEKYLANKAVERYMQKRELHPGRERLDAFDVFRDYSGRMSGSVARKSLQQRMDLLLKDPRIKLDNEFKAQVKEAMTALMTPIDDRFVAARAGMTAYFLGVPNLVGPLIEATQSSTTILPYLIDEGGGFKNGVDAYRKALVQPYNLRNLGQTIETKRLLARATEKENLDPRAMTKEEATALYYRRAADEGSFQYGPIYSATLSRDHNMLTQQAFGLGKSTPKTREQLVTDPLYWAAQKTMYLYSHMSAYNNRIAFLGGLDVLFDKGLRGNELYQAARAFGNLATFGGGKANSIGFTNKLSNPRTRSAFSLIESLQRYTLGQTTMFKDMIADVAGNTDLKGRERSAAQKALATATLAQWMLAGAIGLPGAAIALAVLKEMTGFDGKQKLREVEKHIANGLGADDELAVTMANYAQNGLASNFLGVDMSNRVSNNSILGFNQYDGFDVQGVFGATGGMIQRLIDGTKKVAQGNMVEAGKTIAPPSWTPYFELGQSQAKYGDLALRDKSNRMITPLSKGEAVTYALGLKPQRFRHIKDQQEAVRASNESFSAVRDGKLDDLSQKLLQGNTQATLDHIRQLRAQDPTMNPQGTARAVIDRAVSATHPIDPLAQGAIGNEPALRQIGQSFGASVPRQSEIELLKAREQLNARLGYLGGPPSTSQDVQKAQMVDQLVRSRGMQRGEALRMVELMEKVGMLK